MHFLRAAQFLGWQVQGRGWDMKAIPCNRQALEMLREPGSHISFDVIISTSGICPFVDNKRMIRGDVWLLPVDIGVLQNQPGLGRELFISLASLCGPSGNIRQSWSSLQPFIDWKSVSTDTYQGQKIKVNFFFLPLHLKLLGIVLEAGGSVSQDQGKGRDCILRNRQVGVRAGC